MTVFVYCDRSSTSGRAIARALGVPKISADARGRFKPKATDVVVNWGNTRYPEGWPLAILFNNPGRVYVATVKRYACSVLDEANIPCVETTSSVATAREWEAQGHEVLTRVDGLSQGKGIRQGVFYQAAGGRTFYSKVYKKTHEFRIHVGLSTAGERRMALVYQKKRIREGGDTLIRSYDNGWRFSKNNLVIGEEDQDHLKQLACDAVRALGLDFGAVDILVKMSATGRLPRRIRTSVCGAVVCEINTAPGLDIDELIRMYATYFTEENISRAIS